MNEDTLREKKYYKEKITEMLGKIENPIILMKIYTVVKTHLEILTEKKEQEA